MARELKKQTTGETKSAATKISLSETLSKRAEISRFEEWIVGNTPLITHAWSEKARREMLSKQVKATRGGRETREPKEDFVSSMYEMGDGVYGFPAMGIKNCIISAGHKDKGIAKTSIMAALYLDAHMVRSRPALAGAICDMPLVRIWGSKPEMREDMVRVGAGLNKTATLAYRAQFTTWAIKISGEFNTDILPPEALAFLIQEGGRNAGIGEWRQERKGMFGAFHLAGPTEHAAWEAFASGKGRLPNPLGNLKSVA